MNFNKIQNQYLILQLQMAEKKEDIEAQEKTNPNADLIDKTPIVEEKQTKVQGVEQEGNIENEEQGSKVKILSGGDGREGVNISVEAGQGETLEKEEKESKKSVSAEEGNISEEKIAKIENSLEEQVQQFMEKNKISINSEQLSSFTAFLKDKNQQITSEVFGNWKSLQKNQKEKKSQKVITEVKGQAKKKKIQQKKTEEKIGLNQENPKKQEEPKKQQSPAQIIDEFFINPESKASKQIKWSLVSSINDIIPSKLFIGPQTIINYLNTEIQSHSFENFKEWYKLEQQKYVEEIVKQFRESNQSEEMETHVKKISDIMEMVNSDSSTLNVSVGIGQNKGKSSVKFCLELQQVAKDKFGIQIEIKSKKKSELKAHLQTNLKKSYKTLQYTPFSLYKYALTETEKSVKLQLKSEILSEAIFKNLIEDIEKRYESETKPVFKLQGDLVVKNSIKSQEGKLQMKKVIKWMTQGVAAHLKIKGNQKLLKYFSAPLGEVFPIFKVVKSGEVNLKLRHCENVEKFFQKLGINELCEETPSLSEFAKVAIREYLNSDFFVVVGEILKNALLFASKIPNQRIMFQVTLRISHLTMSLTLSGDSCREIEELIRSQLPQQSS